METKNAGRNFLIKILGASRDSGEFPRPSFQKDAGFDAATFPVGEIEASAM
jgi:hypothetical protein